MNPSKNSKDQQAHPSTALYTLSRWWKTTKHATIPLRASDLHDTTGSTTKEMPKVCQDEEFTYLTQVAEQHQGLADLFSTPLSPTLYYEDLQEHSEDTLVGRISYTAWKVY